MTTAVAAVVVLVSSCSGATEPGDQAAAASTTTIDASPGAALERAQDWMSTNLEDVDNSPSLMFVDYLGRNWDIDDLSPAAHEIARSHEPWGQALLLWRMIDPAYPAPQPPIDDPEDTQQLLSAALYCDQRPVGDAFGGAIDSLTQQGGYMTSHAAIALEWLDEHGCDLDSVDARRGLAVSILASQLRSAPVADDMHLEMAATLVYLGAADQVPASFVELAARQQRSDGGWGINGPDDPSNWHPTFLGLWMLLGVLEGPGNGATMMSVATGEAG